MKQNLKHNIYVHYYSTLNFIPFGLKYSDTSVFKLL